MALANKLTRGHKYRIYTGLREGEVATIVDNTIITKEQDPANQRKITVLINGQTEYVLPRELESEAIGVDPNLLPMDLIREALGLDREPIQILEDAIATQAEALPTPEAVVTQHKAVSMHKRAAADPITDPMDPRLDSFRPQAPKAKLRKYVNRIMKNGMLDVDFLLTFTSNAYRVKNEGRPANVSLKGDTQSGKTLVIDILAILWAERMGYPKPMPVFTVSGSQGVTDFELFGQTTSYMDPELGEDYLVWLRGVVDLACTVGGILYLDEINAMAERVTTALFSVLDHRHQFTNQRRAVLKGGEYVPDVVVASQDLWVLASYNPGYRGMSDMNEAVINRFRHIMWDYDEEVERKLIDSPTVRLLGEKLRLARKANKLRTPVGTSALQALELDLFSFGSAEMATDIITGLFKPQEYAVVEEIIQSGSIIDLLAQEMVQQELNNQA